MSISSSGWGNKVGTADRSCNCGSWKQHWINKTGDNWPNTCSVSGCSSAATLGAHVYHNAVQGERIVPMCAECNALTDKFSLKGGTKIPSANKSSC